MVPALSLRAVTKRYRSPLLGAFAPVTVLRDVDLDVALGEVVVLAGPPASGKTTLLRCAAGVARLTAGRVLWFGTDAVHAGCTTAVALVGDAPRAPATLVLEDAIRYHAAINGRAVGLTPDQAAQLLERLGLASLRGARLSRLPPSVLRRAAIAEALGAGARVLLIDDRVGLSGTGSVDDLARYIGAIAREGVATLLASRRREALPLAGARRLVMQDGRISPPAPVTGGWTKAAQRGKISES